ncbi:MAG: caspase family protein [Anaerolineae bacterium]|nr:caspase family protein [Anaerolineae bacterium]
MGLKSKTEPEDSSVLSIWPEQHTLRLSLGAGALVSPVRSLAFSPDGSVLAIGSAAGTVKLWNLHEGAKIEPLAGHSRVVSSVAFSPGGQVAASGSHDHTLKLWDVATCQELSTLKGHRREVESVAFSSDGQFVVSGSDDGTIRIWNTRDKKTTRILTGHQGPVWSVAISPDSQYIASGSPDKTIKLWNMRQGTEVQSFSAHAYVTMVAFSPQGSLVASGDDWGYISIWNTRTGEPETSIHAHTGRVLSVVFHPDGQCVISAGADGKTRLWNIRSEGKPHSFEGHLSPVFSAVPSPDGRLIASGSIDTTIKLWDIRLDQPLATLTPIGESDWMIVTPDCRFDASPGAMRWMHWVLGLEILDLDQLKARYYEPGLVSNLLTISEAETYPKMEFIDRARRLAAETHQPELVTETGLSRQVNCVAFSPDGKVLASGSRDMNIELRDMATGTQIRTLRGHLAPISSLVFSTNRRTLASGSEGGEIKLWDIVTGKLLHSLTNLSGKVIAGAFHPVRNMLVAGSEGGTIGMWDVATGTELLHLRTEAGIVTLSSDARFVATGSPDGIVVRDVVSGNHMSSIPAFVYPVRRVWGDSDSDSTINLIPKALAFDSAEGVLAVGYAMPRGVQIEEYPPAADTASNGKMKMVITTIGVTVIRPLESAKPWAIKLYKAQDATLCHTLCGHTASVRSVVFSHDGKQLASTSDDGTVRIWDVGQERQICSLETGSFHINALAFSPDGKMLALAEGRDPHLGRITLVDAESGTLIRTFDRHIGDVNPVLFSPDGRTVVMAGEDKVISIWQLDRAGGPLLLKGHDDRVFSLDISDDGDLLVSGSWDGTTRLWDTSSGDQIASIQYPAPIWSVALSPSDSQLLASACADGTIRLWNIAQNTEQGVLGEKEYARRAPYVSGMLSVAFSPDGKLLAGGHANGTIRLWDVDTCQHLQTLSGHTRYVNNLRFSPDGKILASGGYDQTIRLWDVANGALLDTLVEHQVPAVIEKGTSAIFGPDGNVLASGGTDGMLKLWDPATGRELSTFTGHTGSIASLKFNATGDLLVAGSNDATATLWNVSVPTEPRRICSLYSFPDGSWAVIDAEGRFDASNGGNIRWLHWVVGLEPVELSQLKERYYEPGLLHKLFGHGAEPLRDVPALLDVALHPAMEWIDSDPSSPKARLRLMNRGGGIGRVVLSINGKEVTADARSANLDPQADQAELEIDFSDHPYLIPGESNTCEIKAYNAEGYLVSRSLRGVYQAPAKQIEPPNLWTVIAGTSDYQGEELDLRLAAKDAEDVAKALQLGAQRLFGADRVHVTLFTAPSPPPSQDTGGQGQEILLLSDRGTGRGHSTRKNIVQAFETLAKQAKSTDVLVVYLAGHGVSHGGQDGDYYYLTADARTGNLDDPAVRNQTAISSQELTRLIQQVPALKQVLILDTCAAGKLVERLTEQRAIPSSQIRALDRMKDRTGLYILAGSTADAVSYESSRYGQGLLTYSLLLGMRGGALREDEFVDVARLFEFATDQVPRIAKGIGGIQRPLVAIPRGGASFDIGQLAETDRQQIPVLRQAIPLVLRANFQDEILLLDHLGLAKRVNNALRERSDLGRAAPLVFMDADELPDAYALVGRYHLDGDSIQVTVHLFRSGHPAGDFEVQGSRAEVEQLVVRILDALVKKLGAPG